MSAVEVGNIFGFDTWERKDAVEAALEGFHKNPYYQAQRLFGNVREYPHLFLGMATQRAVRAVGRVLKASAQENLHGVLDPSYPFGDENVAGCELARLFLITPSISPHAAVEEYYQDGRKQILEALAMSFSQLTLAQMATFYERVGIGIRPDGNFTKTIAGRRTVEEWV